MPPKDLSPEYIESVRKAILEHDPNEEIDEDSLRKTAYYLRYRGYVLDEVDAVSCEEWQVWYTYDVLKWTEAEL